MDVTVNYHRYAGFFHFRELSDVPPLIEWLRSRFEMFSASLEHLDHENKTDRHIQWCGQTNREWTRSDTSLFDVKGRLGKHLITEKRPNAGSKSSKRHSKIDAVKEGYDWKSCILYVMKDQKTTENTWWVEDGVEKDTTQVIGVFEYPSVEAKRKKEAGKASTFFELCCEKYEESGCPTQRRDIVQMLAECYVFGKWQNMDIRAMCRMADTLLMKYHGSLHIHDVMARYDEFISSSKF